MSKSYDALINDRHIKLGGQRILIAPLTADAITAKIADMSSPPSGWRDLGALQDSMAELTTTKEIYSLKAGIPEVIVFQDTVGAEATLKATLIEWSILNMWEDRKSTRLNSSHTDISRMPSSA